MEPDFDRDAVVRQQPLLIESAGKGKKVTNQFADPALRFLSIEPHQEGDDEPQQDYLQRIEEEEEEVK